MCTHVDWAEIVLFHTSLLLLHVLVGLAGPWERLTLKGILHAHGEDTVQFIDQLKDDIKHFIPIDTGVYISIRVSSFVYAVAHAAMTAICCEDCFAILLAENFVPSQLNLQDSLHQATDCCMQMVHITY